MRFRPDVATIATGSAFVAVIGTFALTTEGFVSSSTIRIILQGLGTIGLGALALGVTMLAGELDLAVPAIATIAAIAGMRLGGGEILGVVFVAVAVGLAIGIAQGLIVQALAISSLVFTLGSLITLKGVALVMAGRGSVPSPDIGWAFDLQRPILAIFTPLTLTASGVFILVGSFLTFTRAGRDHLAIGGGRREAVAAGVSARAAITTTFALSGAIAGLAGALMSIQSGSASATLFDGLLLPAITAALLGGISLSGGRGHVLGIAVGVITLTALTSGMALNGAPFYMPALATAALLLVVITIEIGAAGHELRSRVFGKRSQPRASGLEHHNTHEGVQQ